MLKPRVQESEWEDLPVTEESGDDWEDMPLVGTSEQAAPLQSEPDRPFFGSVGGTVKALGRGLAEGLTTELPGMAGRAIQFATPDIIKENIGDPGKALADWSEETALKLFGEQPEDQSELERIVYEGSKMLAPSIIPGGLIGAGARSLLGIGKIVKAAKAAEIAGDVAQASSLFAQANRGASLANKIAAGGTAGLFGASQAQQTVDSANQQADKLEQEGRYDEAQEIRAKGEGVTPYVTGGIEAAGEYFGTKYLGKLFGLDEAEVVKRGAKTLVTNFLKTLGVEVGTEIGQSFGEAAVEKHTGIRPDAHPLAEALEVIGPTVFMTVLTGGAGAAVNKVAGKKADPNAERDLLNTGMKPREDRQREKFTNDLLSRMESGEETPEKLQDLKNSLPKDHPFNEIVDGFLNQVPQFSKGSLIPEDIAPAAPIATAPIGGGMQQRYPDAGPGTFQPIGRPDTAEQAGQVFEQLPSQSPAADSAAVFEQSPDSIQRAAIERQGIIDETEWEDMPITETAAPVALDEAESAEHAQVDQQAHEAATSPQNELQEPTQGQKDAGNYKHGHINVQGLDISIENPEGSQRKGKDKTGKEWSSTITGAHYGYFKRTEGKDGDQVDTFINPGIRKKAYKAYVVDQVDPETGKLDEQKVMMGYPSIEAAREAYLANYEKGWNGIGAITPAPIEVLKDWLKSGKSKKSFIGSKWGISGDMNPLANKNLPDGSLRHAEVPADVSDIIPASIEPDSKGNVPSELTGSLVAGTQPSSIERPDNRSGRDTKQTTDLVKRPSLGSETDSFVNIPTQASGSMQDSMEGLNRKFKVINGIVQAVPINVMDDLAPSKGPAKMPLHDDSMLKPLSPAVDTNESVRGAVIGEKSDVAPGVGSSHDETSLVSDNRSITSDSSKSKGKVATPEAPKVTEPAKSDTQVVSEAKTGLAFVGNKKRPIMAAREITEGKKKGMVEVALTRGRDPEGNIIPGMKKKIARKDVIEWPGAPASGEAPTTVQTQLAGKPTLPEPSKEEDFISPIDRTASQKEKADQLRKLGKEAEPEVAAIVHQIEKDLGLESKYDFKELKKIIEKANRPSIKEFKPWHDVEHIRDSLRFKAVINNFDDLVDIAKILKQQNIEVIKLDTWKMIEPKEWGWRFVSFDLRMPNGLIVEFYAPLVELEEAKKAGNHALFEKWRNVDEYDIIKDDAKWDEYGVDLQVSDIRYQEAWEKALDRLHLDDSAATASFRKVEASLSSLTRTKLSLRSSAEKMPEAQTPAIRLAEGLGKDLSKTSTLSLSRSIETKPAIETPPLSSTNITIPEEKSKGKVTEESFRAKLERTGVAIGPDGASYSIQHEDRRGYYVRKTDNGVRSEYGGNYQAGGWSMEQAREKAVKEAGPFEPLTKAVEVAIIKAEKAASEMTADELLAEWDNQAAEVAPPALTAKDKAKETADHIKNAINAFKDINRILGETGKIGTEVDPVLWDQIKPALQLAWDELVAAGKSGKEFVALALKNLSPKGRPYFEKFVREQAKGETNEPIRTDDERPPEGERTGEIRGAGEGELPGRVLPVQGGTGAVRKGESSEGRGAAGGRSGSDRDAGLSDYTITAADNLGQGGPKQKYRDNISAIRLLSELKDRQATPEEQSILVKYVGWGGLAQAFYKPDGTVTSGWEAEAKELRGLLPRAEYEAARKSTQDAHYTSKTIIDGIYAGLERLGFTRGRILEPSVGTGNLNDWAQGYLNQYTAQIPSEASRPVFASAFERHKDDWFAEKDWQTHKNSVEAARLQEAMKEALGEKSYNQKVKDMDKAIHIYLDLKRNPDHAEEYRNDLTSEQQKILDLAMGIEANPRLVAIADYIANQYEQTGLNSMSQGVIHNVLENYVGRAWKIKDKIGTDTLQKFKTTSRHAKQRVFETILEGQAHGFELQIEGATNNLNLLKDEIARTIEDKKLVQHLLKETDAEDKPLLAESMRDGYKAIEHPNFTYWGPFMSIKEGEIKTYGRGHLVTSRYGAQKKGNSRATRLFDTPAEVAEYISQQDNPGEWEQVSRHTVREKKQLYAPTEIADRLNKILGTSKLKGQKLLGIPVIDIITKYNAVFKSWILLTSFFHHLAFMRSYLLGTRHKTAQEWRPIKSYKAGLKAIKAFQPEVELLVRNGLTLGRMQDWEENILRGEDTIFGKALDKLTGSTRIKDKISELRDRQADFLFKNFGAGLKVQAALIEYRNALKEHPEMDTNERAKMIANLINDDFGGLHLQRLERNQTYQHIFRLFALAPDWCVPADTRAMTKTGWKYHHELEIGKDEVMAFDPKTKTLRWSKLNDKYVNDQYSGKMVQIKNVNRAVLMTPEHTCYVYNSTKKKYEIVKAKELQTNHQIPRCAEYPAPETATYDDMFVRLVGWIVTDGYVKKSTNKLANGDQKEYRYGKIVQSKPEMVEVLKGMGLPFHTDEFNSDHDKFVSNHIKHVFTIPADHFQRMEKEGVSDGLTWEFLSKLTKGQRQILYDTMMMGDGTGQKRFCGKEKEVFYMTMLQNLMGLPTTFYQQEENCWRTRWITRGKGISCWGHHNNKTEVDYSGTIWCPSVDTGFWLAEREGMVFITGNTESNIRSMVKAFKAGGPEETRLYRRFWTSIVTKGITATVLANLLMGIGDDDDPLERFKKAWAAGNFRWLDVDVTAVYKFIYNTMGLQPTDARKYFSLVGHFKDPVKFVFHPTTSAKHKGSVLFRTVQEALTGTDWKGERFTTVSELLGVDDKGVYLTNVKGKHKIGEPKGGKLFGQTVTYGGKQGTVGYEQVPSYVLGQLKGIQPVQVQNLLAWAAGEIEGFDAINRSFGLHTSSTYPTDRTRLEDWSREYVDVRAEGKSLVGLKKKVIEYNRNAEPTKRIPWSKIVKKGNRIRKAEKRAEAHAD